MLVTAKATHMFNDFGDGGITYLKGYTYEAECLENGAYTVKHPCGGGVGFSFGFL